MEEYDIQKLYLISLFIALIVSIPIMLYFYRTKTTCGENYDGKILILRLDQTPIETKNKNVDIIDLPMYSNNMTPNDWVTIGQTLLNEYNKYHTFIVTHDRDTMSYTASALSFMMENINKPIYVTDDIKLAMVMAKKYSIPEVGICTQGKLYRGNRYGGPYPHLGDIHNLYDKIILKSPTDKFRFLPINPKNRVVVIKMFPGIDTKFLNGVTRGEIHGIVLEQDSTTPTTKEFLIAVRELVKKGIVVCSVGNVGNTGNDLESVGVISGGDMTTEAAVTKIYFLLSHLKDPNHRFLTNLIQQNTRGEITSQPTEEVKE